MDATVPVEEARVLCGCPLACKLLLFASVLQANVEMRPIVGKDAAGMGISEEHVVDIDSEAEQALFSPFGDQGTGKPLAHGVRLQHVHGCVPCCCLMLPWSMVAQMPLDLLLNAL